MRQYQAYGDIDYTDIKTIEMFFEDSERSKQFFPSRIIENWQAGLSPARIKIFWFDDICLNDVVALKNIVDYIGGDWSKRLRVVSPTWNRKAKYPAFQVDSQARAWVAQQFTEELEACADLLGCHAKDWVQKHRSIGYSA